MPSKNTYCTEQARKCMCKRVWGFWSFCVIAKMLILSLVSTFCTVWMARVIEICPLCLSAFAHQAFAHYKSHTSHNTITSWTRLQNKEKIPKAKAAHRMTERSALKPVCDIDTRRNDFTPLQPAEGPMTLLKTLEQGQSGHSRLIPVDSAQKATFLHDLSFAAWAFSHSTWSSD